VGPVHLYDLLLGILGIFSAIIILRNKKFAFSWPILVLLGLSLIYLSYSFIARIGAVNHIIRHYALFLYLGVCYLIFQSYINEQRHGINLRFLILIGIASMGLQIAYLLYLIFSNPHFDIRGFNYFSPMVIMGVLIGLAFFLTLFQRRLFLKITFAAIAFFLALTFGHASAFLAALTIVGCYFFMRWPAKIKVLIAAGFTVLILTFLQFLPQFSDTNATFRVVYWENLLRESVTEYYGVLGHGFGVPYGTEETFSLLSQQAGAEWFNYRPEERYLAPSHNSFLTIVFHTGLISVFLIMIPLRKAFQYFFKNKGTSNPTTEFLLLSLAGLTVWASFNVILELPHSSGIYWLVYFSALYHFSGAKNTKN
jgi:hypothetical protein